ncbi:MAG TPA: BON domain-containing protein [Terriglobales bacterium]|nr:BON domain-containing protein [Terriglobales bacterium]
MKNVQKLIASLFMAGLLSAPLVAQTSSAARYDNDIQARVTKQLADKKEFRNVQAATEDGIVTLTGTVDLYQQKLDAAKKARKTDKVSGVRNLIEVSSAAPDDQIEARLDRKIYFDRVGYFDNRFNHVTVDVKDGVATLSGETMDYVARDSAVAIANRMPGVKDVVNNITVSPTSGFDDQIRVQATRAIYRDPVLSRYATDPAAPIRIVVSNGKLSLYGTVASAMDKQIAGMRAGQVFGVFSVQNNLDVVKGS